MSILNARPDWTLGDVRPAQVKTAQLATGVVGNLQTVEVMKKVARERSGHPIVRQLALDIIHRAQIPSQNYRAEAIAIGNFVQKHVRYIRDANGIEQLHDPLTMIDQIKRGVCQGDCDDMSLLIATLLLAIGHQPFYRTVRYQPGSGSYSHIYVVVYEKNWGEKRKQRIVLDAILKRHKTGTEVPHVSGAEHKV